MHDEANTQQLASTLGQLNSLPDEAAIRELCGHLFEDPARIIQTFSYDLVSTVEFTPHQHHNQMQLDLLIDCHGQVCVDNQWHPITGTTALVAYPGQMHGYKLFAATKEAHVFHLKIQTKSSWLACTTRPWQSVITDLGRQDALISHLRSVIRLGLFTQDKSTLLLIRLCEALYLWPRESSSTGTLLDAIASTDEQNVDRRVIKALELVEQAWAQPPSLDQLAHAAHLSPRHFSRRFRLLLGCTPHEYVTARRLQKASAMLLDDRLKVHQIADGLGFSSVGVFSRWFVQHAGQSPTEFRSNPHVI